jgi:predicted negative regulator of RcsB-dependent stress response
METHTTEEQQIAAARTWLKQNGASIVTGVILGFAALFGTRAWFAWQDNQAQMASDLYAVMISALESGNNQAVTDKAGMLIAEHSGSGYAAMAALALARVRIEEGELEGARANLQWVLDNSDVDYLRDTARLRLARVLLALEDMDGAARVLEQAGSGQARSPLVAELMGDIHHARGEPQLAQQAYQEALAGMGDEYPGQQLLQIKYEASLGADAAGAVSGQEETPGADAAAAGSVQEETPGTDAAATAGSGQ